MELPEENFPRDVPHGRHGNLDTDFWGPPLRRFWDFKKPSKIQRDVGQHQTSIANISGTHQDIDKRKAMCYHYQLQSLPRSRKKMLNFGPLTTELRRLLFTHPNSTFTEGHISAPRGAAPSNFYTC